MNAIIVWAWVVSGAFGGLFISFAFALQLNNAWFVGGGAAVGLIAAAGELWFCYRK